MSFFASFSLTVARFSFSKSLNSPDSVAKFTTLLIGERAPSHNAIVSGECSVSSGVRLEIGAVLAQFRPDRRSDVFKLMKKCKNLDPDRWRASTWRRSPRTPITQTPTYLHELFSGAQNVSRLF
jgi:hypothetical protein